MPNYILKYCLKPLSNAPNQGWTLIEVVTVTVVVGILASMSFPSFNKMQAKNELRGAMSEVEAAFREAQRNAMKQGSTCTVDIATGNGSSGTISATPAGCIPLAVAMPDDNDGGSLVTLSIDPSATTSIDFSFKGNPDVSVAQNIILSSSVTSLEPRCLVISPGIGLMRSGYWDSGSSTCTTAL